MRVAEQGFTQVGGSVLAGAVLRNDGGEPAEGVEVRFEARAAGADSEPISPVSDVYAVLRDRDRRIVGGLTAVTLQEDWPPGTEADLLLTAEPELPAAVDADVSVDAETG